MASGLFRRGGFAQAENGRQELELGADGLPVSAPGAGRKPWLRLRDLRLKRSTPPPPSPPILRQPVYFPYIHPNGSAGAELILYFEQRGRYAQNAFGISTRFPFSFLMKTRSVPLSRELIVYPKIERSEHFDQVLPLLSGEFEHQVRGRGHDLYLIRDYQPDDSARHVDWKSSAKTGSLKIRELPAKKSVACASSSTIPRPATLLQRATKKA